MHSVLLGVVKELLEAWFSIKFKLKPWKTFPDIYYQYFLCLVEPMHILLSESISKEALQKASLLLKKINVQLRSLYGEQS